MYFTMVSLLWYLSVLAIELFCTSVELEFSKKLFRWIDDFMSNLTI